VWDGVPRLETWLQTYLTVPDSEYARAVGPRWLISAVARIYEPGCRADHVLILEGAQGEQKSTAVRVLAVNPSWSTGRLSQLSNKDAMMEVAGVWLVEIAELDALSKAKTSAIKQFLTNPNDRFRPPYGKYVTRQSRQCVFAGTINPPVGGYLTDITGNRRYWPVRCLDRIDLDALKRDRDMLWAEAVVQFKAGAPWWLETPELEALATAEQEARVIADPWEPMIRKLLDKRDSISVTEALEELGLFGAQQTQIAMNRVAKILARLGLTQHRPRAPDGRRERRYYREPINGSLTNPDQPDQPRVYIGHTRL